MKLKKFEISIIMVTAAAVVFCIGFYIGRGSSGDVVINISPDEESVDEQQALDPTQATEDGANKTSVSEQESPMESGSVNINTADIYELMELPGIGEVLANRIIEYRTENGAFSYPEEILSIDGIGEKVFSEIEEYITT